MNKLTPKQIQILIAWLEYFYSSQIPTEEEQDDGLEQVERPNGIIVIDDRDGDEPISAGSDHVQ